MCRLKVRLFCFVHIFYCLCFLTCPILLHHLACVVVFHEMCTAYNSKTVCSYVGSSLHFHLTGGPAPSIPGPYHSPEQTEAFPLKQSLYKGSGGAGNRARGLRSLTRCCSGSADNSSAGLRIIVLCFMALNVVVIVSLAVQIYYGDYQVSNFEM